MNNNLIKMFKKNVPKQKKVYQTYMQDCKIKNFSYTSFKKNNIILIEIKDYLMTLDEYYYLSETQINNMFNFLKQNITINNFTLLKKAYKHLNDLSDFLSERYNSKDSLHGKDSKNNCLYIINKIVELKNDIASRKGYNTIEIEKTISFENVITKLFNPKEFVFDENKLLYLIENYNFIFNRDRNNNDFNDNFCKCVERSRINREKHKYNYYKSMYNYLSTIKDLNLDTQYLDYLFDINIQNISEDIINKKLSSMRIDSKTGNRMVEDYIISIDNDVTKKIDDAFSIEKIGNNYLLGIHIANVYSLGYFEEDSLDVNQKGNVNKSKASLSRNKKRNATSIYILIDNNGIVRKYKILNTVLKANANLVYDDIPHLIRNDDVNPVLKNTVINLLSVYNLLENEKFPNNPTISNFAYLITSKLMILCCTLYSEEFKNNNISAIYLCGDKNNNYYSLDASSYNTGFENYNTYAKVTSPIYDRSSLINQFFINRYILQKRYMNEEEKNEMNLKLVPIVEKLNKNKYIDS